MPLLTREVRSTVTDSFTVSLLSSDTTHWQLRTVNSLNQNSNKVAEKQILSATELKQCSKLTKVFIIAVSKWQTFNVRDKNVEYKNVNQWRLLTDRHTDTLPATLTQTYTTESKRLTIQTQCLHQLLYSITKKREHVRWQRLTYSRVLHEHIIRSTVTDSFTVSLLSSNPASI